MNKKLNFTCPKCGNTSYETGEIRTTCGFLSNTPNYTRPTAACWGIFSTCSPQDKLI